MSEACNPSQCTKEFLQDLAMQSVQRNQRTAITGFLVYSAPFYFQLIEGPRDAVENLYRSISQDERHTHVTTLMDSPCEERQYRNWWMNLTNMNDTALHPAISIALTRMAASFVWALTYLPQNAASMLLQGRTPSLLPPVPYSATIMFLHIVEFNSILQEPRLTNFLPDLLDVFVDLCVRMVCNRGGQIAKFVNGTCMAYWPQDKAGAAVLAAQALQGELAARQAAEAPAVSMQLLRVAAGMHCGPTLLGNAGTTRADCTLLGTSVNVAARVSALAVRLRWPLLMSREAAEQARADPLCPRLWSVGSHAAKGVPAPVPCYRVEGQGQQDPTLAEVVSSLTVEDNVSTYPQAPRRPTVQFPDTTLPSLFSEPLVLGFPALRRTSLKTCLAKLCNSGELEPDSQTDLVTLTYISQDTCPQGKEDLAPIMRAAARQNDAMGVTGCVIYLNGVFLHTMEGSRQVLQQLWRDIQADPRHTDCVAVHYCPLHGRRTYAKALEVVHLSEEQLSHMPPLQLVFTQLARAFLCMKTYLPSLVTRCILQGMNPQHLPPIEARVVMLAADLCEFTQICARAMLTAVLQLCNTFIDCCSEAITQGGGEVVKLVGDCVIAYFPATNADHAFDAVRGIMRGCAEIRKNAPGATAEDCRGLLWCGVGLDYGPAIITQCRTSGITEYMVTGPVSARVMEVESLTRKCNASVVMTDAFREQLSHGDHLEALDAALHLPSAVIFKPLGPEFDLDCAELQFVIDSAFKQPSSTVDTFSNSATSSSTTTFSLTDSFRYLDLPRMEDPEAEPTGRKLSVKKALKTMLLSRRLSGAVQIAPMEVFSSPMIGPQY